MLGLLDLLSTLCFAGIGASIALSSRMNVPVVCLSAMLASTGGGTIREILLGSGTLFWIETPGYLLAVLLSFPAVFLLKGVAPLPAWVVQAIFSLATSVFVLVGVLASLQAGCDWVTVLLMGVLTGTGGGIIRQLVCERRLPKDVHLDILSAAAAVSACAGLVSLGLGVFACVCVTGVVHFAVKRAISGARLLACGGPAAAPRRCP